MRSICLLWGDPQCLRRYGDGLRAGWPVFDSHQWQAIFLYVTASRLALAPTQPAKQAVLLVIYPGREADLPLLSTAHTSSWRGV